MPAPISKKLALISDTSLMISGRQIDRRSPQTRAIRLGQPLFMLVSKELAMPVLTACGLVTILASYATPAVGFGPFFLVVCAFGAWFVGNQFAVLLGLYIASVQIVNGHAVTLQEGPIIMALKFCSALAVVLMLGVARAALEIEWRLARVDPLTGALNRKAFFEAVEKEASQSGPTVLIFADVDGLKRLNDRLGHEAGDEALRDFAGRVEKAIRKDDIFARIGGDEFVILLKVRDIAAAELLALRLNRVLNFTLREEGATLNCSLGVLVLPTGSKSIDAELKQADTLMYHAKRAGIGLMMATSIKGHLQELLPFARPTKSTGQQRAGVRSATRTAASCTGDTSLKGPVVA